MKLPFGWALSRAKDHDRITELNGVRLTPTQQLAYMQAESAAFDMMATIRWAKRLAWVVLLIVMTISYEDQNHYLEHAGFRPYGAKLIPLAFDVATVCCVGVIGAAAMRFRAKVVALVIVLFPVLSSGYVNVMASPTMEVAIVYVMVVALIPGIELVKAFMGPNYDYMRRIESQLLGFATPEPPPVESPGRTLSDEERVRRALAGKHTRYRKLNGYRQTKYRQANGGAPAKPGTPEFEAAVATALMALTPADVAELEDDVDVVEGVLA